MSTSVAYTVATLHALACLAGCADGFDWGALLAS